MNLKRNIVLLTVLLIGGTTFGQSGIRSIAEIHQNIIPVKYDSSFIRPNNQTTPHEKAGLVGQKMTFAKAPAQSSIFWPDGEQFSSSTPTIYFTDREFEIIEYKKGKNSDYFVVENIDGKWIFANTADVDWYLNGFLEKSLRIFGTKRFYSLHKQAQIQGLNGKTFELGGAKPLTITNLSFEKISRLNRGLVVTFDNGLTAELIPSSKSGENWINIKSGMNVIPLVSKQGLRELSKDSPSYFSAIRSQKLRIGMTMEEVILSWGRPTQNDLQEHGYDAVWEYGDATYSQRLFFKGDKLVYIL